MLHMQMKMPSGRTVTAQATCRIFDHLHCLLSLSVCVHAEDMRDSEGLCGNYNDNADDDTVPHGLTDPDPNFLEPVIFSSSYM